MSHNTALEAAAKSLKDSFTASIENSAGVSFKDTGVTMPADWIWERYAVAAISAYISTLSPDVSGLVERLKYEAEAMRLAPSANGEDFGDTLHASNWADKPHRVLFDAVELIKQSADALTALSLQLEASERLRKAAEADTKRILDINRKHCEAVNTYIVLNARLQERADALETQLADRWEVISSADREALRVVTEENERLREVLEECCDYFDNRADADCDLDGFIPNREMEMLSKVKSALEPLRVTKAVTPSATSENDRFRRMVERRDEFIIAKGLWDEFKEATSNAS